MKTKPVEALKSLRAILARGPRREISCPYHADEETRAAIHGVMAALPEVPEPTRQEIDKFLAYDLALVKSLPAPRSILRRLAEFIEDCGGRAAGGAAGLPPEQTTILEALADNQPTTMTREDLTTPTRLTEKTIGLHLAQLRKKKFAYRPAGPKKGHTITEAGLLAIGR